MNKAQLIASRLLESDKVDDVFDMLTGREYLHTLLKSMRFVITGEDARWKAVLQLPDHNMAIQVTPAEQIMWRGLVTDPEGYVRVGYLNRNGDEWVGRTLAEDDLALYLEDALKRINAGDYRLPYEKLTRYKFRKPRTPEEKERQDAYWRSQQKGNDVAEALLEAFDKDDLEFWGGQDHVRRTLQQEGWSYRPPGNFTTWDVHRVVRMRNGNTVEVRVHPRRSHRAWFVSVWDPDDEPQHYWTVPNVHDDRVIDAAREVVDTLETWRDDNLANVPVESQLSIALKQSFDRYTRREEPQLGESLGDDLDNLVGVETIMRDLRRLGWRIEDDNEPGPYRAWRAYKDFAWRNIGQNSNWWVAARLGPVYGGHYDPASYVIDLHQGRQTTPVAGISPFRVIRYAEWLDELFAHTDYDPALSPLSNLDRTLSPVSAHMKATTGKDMWESEDAKDFVMSSHWDSDPDETIKRMGFKQARRHGEYVKIVPLKHPVPWYEGKFFVPSEEENRHRGMTEVGISVGEAFDHQRSKTDPDNPHVVTQAAYWPLDMKRSINVGSVTSWSHGIHVTGQHYRTVYGSAKHGDLSTRIETVVRALEDAIRKADNGTRYKDDYDFFHAVNRYWGKQPNRIVRPYTRKKKKRAPAAPAPAPEDIPEPPQLGG